MANEQHVSGPISSLPGSNHAVEDGACCDDHPERPAVLKRQGETDSFGSEFYYLCAECVETEKSAPEEDTSGTCDWCKNHAPKLRPQRDPEEGLCGRVYYICVPCKEKYEKYWSDQYDDQCRDFGD